MIFKDSEIVIRSATKLDCHSIMNWWNSGSVMAHAGFPNGLNLSKEEVLSTIEQNQQLASQLLIIEVGDISIGECNYKIIGNEAQVGIKICEPHYQNKGIGTKILRLLIKSLFSDKELNYIFDIKKITVEPNLKNTRAQRVYEKLGFNKVAIRHNSWTNQVGELESSVKYELLRTDFSSTD